MIVHFAPDVSGKVDGRHTMNVFPVVLYHGMNKK